MAVVHQLFPRGVPRKGKHCYKCGSHRYFRCNTTKVWVIQNIGSRKGWAFEKRSYCVPKCMNQKISAKFSRRVLAGL